MCMRVKNNYLYASLKGGCSVGLHYYLHANAHLTTAIRRFGQETGPMWKPCTLPSMPVVIHVTHCKRQCVLPRHRYPLDSVHVGFPEVAYFHSKDGCGWWVPNFVMYSLIQWVLLSSPLHMLRTKCCWLSWWNWSKLRWAVEALRAWTVRSWSDVMQHWLHLLAVHPINIVRLRTLCHITFGEIFILFLARTAHTHVANIEESCFMLEKKQIYESISNLISLPVA